HGSVAIGHEVVSTGIDAIAMCYQASATGETSIAIGRHVAATGTNSYVFGRGNHNADRLTNNINNSLIVGFSNQATLFVNNGHVAVNTTNPNGYDFNVNGSTFCTHGVWDASDERFKKDIEPIENAGAQLVKLQGVTYNW